MINKFWVSINVTEDITRLHVIGGDNDFLVARCNRVLLRIPIPTAWYQFNQRIWHSYNLVMIPVIFQY